MTSRTDTLWRRVQRHDAGADGLFVYAVTSTGIYCRPSCPSRRPRRDRVAFFPTPAMAEARGFRPCQRCRPDRPRELPAAAARVRQGCEAIARAPERAWTSRRIAAAAGVSVPQLQRAFRAALGIAPRDYVSACRHRRFLDRLRAERQVTAAVFDAGYGSFARAYEAHRQPGMTPATYAKGGRGAEIDWITTASPLGSILVAATPRGLCAVAVGVARDAARDHLVREFPHARVADRPSARLDSLARAVRALAANGRPAADLPADIAGTAFQWKVWRALQAIPPGDTLTYAQIAARIGAPKAARAVGRACATNPVALVIPCHRAIGSDGSLHGYRWGMGVKAALLARERGGRTPPRA